MNITNAEMTILVVAMILQAGTILLWLDARNQARYARQALTKARDPKTGRFVKG